MIRSSALDGLRTKLMEVAVSTPVAGEDYMEINARVRGWVLDIARSMNQIYVAVNQHDMELSELAIPTAVDVGQSVLTDGVTLSGVSQLKGHIGTLGRLVVDAAEAEDTADYSPLFAASRTAVQAVSAALDLVNDYDIFSVVARAGAVVEQCVLANAYSSLSRDFDGTVAPTTKEVMRAIADARAEMVPLYEDGLIARLKDNTPGEFERPVVLSPSI